MKTVLCAPSDIHLASQPRMHASSSSLKRLRKPKMAAKHRKAGFVGNTDGWYYGAKTGL
jgi:hypothetical protein